MMMKAAVVTGAGQVPIYADFPEPERLAGEDRIVVHAAAVSPLAKGRASGSHYSASGQFPFVAGVDGVGRREDGKRVYFALPRAPYGSMAQVAVAPSDRCIVLPDDLDDVTAAAVANPGMSSWAAFSERARLEAGETVLVNGATGAAGRLAIQIAKYRGAGRVIATGRDVEALKSLAALGADATIALGDDPSRLEDEFKAHFAEGVDVVIDYLWGSSAERLIVAAAKAAKGASPIRIVQVGAASGGEISLQGAALRSSAISLMGSGIGSIPLDRLVKATGEFLHAVQPGDFQIASRPVPLSEVETAWSENNGKLRTVFTIHAA